MSPKNPTPTAPRKSHYTVSSMDLGAMMDSMLEKDEVQMAYCMDGMVFVIFYGDRIFEGSLLLPAPDFLENDLLERTGTA